MNRSNETSRDRISLFFILSLFAWVIWGSQLAHRYGWLPWAPSLRSPLNALTVWSPGLAALLLSALASGKKGISALLKPLLAVRAPFAYFAFVLLFEPCKWAAAYGIDRLLGHHYALGLVPLARHFGASAAYMIPVALLFTLPNAIGEELGWRGYALPRLQKKMPPLAAAVMIGLFWGLWHLPMWIWTARNAPSPLALLIMALSMVPASVLLTWIFNRTGGSLFFPCLYHASMAAKGYLLPSLPGLTETILLWLAAIFIVTRLGLKPRHPDTRISEEREPSSIKEMKHA